MLLNSPERIFKCFKATLLVHDVEQEYTGLKDELLCRFFYIINCQLF